jgi:hypothetical protein
MTTTFTWSNHEILHYVPNSITEGTVSLPFHWCLTAVSSTKPLSPVDTMGFINLDVAWDYPNPPEEILIPKIQEALGGEFIAQTKSMLQKKLDSLPN